MRDDGVEVQAGADAHGQVDGAGLALSLVALALVGLRYLGLDTAFGDELAPGLREWLGALNDDLPRPKPRRPDVARWACRPAPICTCGVLTWGLLPRSVGRDGGAVRTLPRPEGSIIVYVRTTEVQGDPAKIDEGIATVRESTFPAVSDMGGCVGMSLLVDRESGRCIATTAWESEDAMRGTAEQVRPLRDEAEQTLGSSGSEVHQWEVAVVHRDHASPDGACARLTWLSVEPGTADRAIDTYKLAVLPRLQEMDGFCSATLMVDSATGRVVGTVAFDSREALEATRQAALAIRERVAGELGATIEKVEEMEIAFAHLHVPEMA